MQVETLQVDPGHVAASSPRSTWHAGPALRTCRSAPGAALHAGAIYVAGGSGGATGGAFQLTSVERLRPAGGSGAAATWTPEVWGRFFLWPQRYS